MSKDHSRKIGNCPDIIDDFCIQDHQHLDADLVKEFDREGFWFRYVVREVNLDKIAYKSWIPERVADTIELLRSSGKTKPIKLGRIDKNTHKFLMIDGNHRCTACAECGYKAIPAIVEEKHTAPPFNEEEMDKWRFYNEISKWLFDWKQQMKSIEFTIVVNAISSQEVEANFYVEKDPLIAYIYKTGDAFLYTVSSLQFESPDEQLFLDRVAKYLITSKNLIASKKFITSKKF